MKKLILSVLLVGCGNEYDFNPVYITHKPKPEVTVVPSPMPEVVIVDPVVIVVIYTPAQNTPAQNKPKKEKKKCVKR